MKNRPLKKHVFHEKQILVVRDIRKLPLLHKASHLTGKLAISNNISHKNLSNLTLHHETLNFFVELLSQHYFWLLQHIMGPVTVRFDYKTEQEIIKSSLHNKIRKKKNLNLTYDNLDHGFEMQMTTHVA